MSQGHEYLRHPMQPIYLDAHNTARFKPNAIIEYLLKTGRLNFNEIIALPFTAEDRMQLAQLLGYSITAYGECPYVTDESYAAADKIGQGLFPMPDAGPFEKLLLDPNAAPLRIGVLEGDKRGIYLLEHDDFKNICALLAVKNDSTPLNIAKLCDDENNPALGERWFRLSGPVKAWIARNEPVTPFDGFIG